MQSINATHPSTGFEPSATPNLQPAVARTLARGVSKKALWAGRVMSALPVLMLLMSATMKFVKPPAAVEGFNHLGVSESLAFPLGILELACVAVYVAPQTCVLGAILLTGYLGGAILSHLRVGDPFFTQVILGVLLWGGLFLREPRLRALIPLRRQESDKAPQG